MHAELDLLTIFFHLFLFGLIVYKIIGLVREYLVPMLKQMRNDEHRNILSLIEREKLLQSSGTKVYDQIQQQKRKFLVLTRNLEQTNVMLQKNEEAARQKEVEITKALQEKREEQSKQFALQKAALEVLPEILQRAEADLVKHYEGIQGDQALEKLIKRLDEVAGQDKAKVLAVK